LYIFKWQLKWQHVSFSFDVVDDEGMMILQLAAFPVHPSNVTSLCLTFTSQVMHLCVYKYFILELWKFSPSPPCESYFSELYKELFRINNVCISGCLPIYSFAFNEWPEDEHGSIVSVIVSLEHTRRFHIPPIFAYWHLTKYLSCQGMANQIVGNLHTSYVNSDFEPGVHFEDKSIPFAVPTLTASIGLVVKTK